MTERRNDDGGSDGDVDPLATPLQAALRHRAGGITPAGRTADHVRHRVANRRRRRAAASLAVASAVVLGGLVALSLARDGSNTTSSADRPSGSPASVPTTLPGTAPRNTSPALDAIPLPTIGAYPRDPGLGPQPTKVTYTVVEGDTFETIAAKLGMDPATVKTQSGGEIKVGEVIAFLVGPSVAARAGVSSTTIA